MYSQHFGLTQDPFSIAPDPRYLFMSERHREALAHLLYGVAGSNQEAGGTGGGFVLLTGDIGTGKTTICRCFLEQIPSGCHVAYIFNPKLTVTELLQSICEEFHITVAPPDARVPTLKDHIDALNAFLLQSHANGQSSLLIIDEAQNLESDVLEQLRLLTNLETNARKLLQIVLIGQPELRTMLARAELEQLAQRVIARFHLDALSDAESTQYIRHRLAVAGHNAELPFDRGALRRIHRLTRGVPRRINLLCGRALLGAWANGLHRVNRAVVDKAAAEVFGPDAASASGVATLPLSYALAGLGLFVALALSGLYLWPNQPKAQAIPSVARPVLAASAPNPQAATLSPGGLAPPGLESIQPLLAQLPRDISAAWSELAPLWQLPTSATDPCQSAAAQRVQCYRSASLSLPMLRQLGRPGILTLQSGNEPPAYALLVGLDEHSATLRLGQHPRRVSLAELSRLWRGDFASYWRVPTGYSSDFQDGSSGPAITRLASQLSRFEGVPTAPASAPAPILDAALRERVRAFQRAFGLKPDGQPGPLTFMQLDRVAGASEPALQAQSQ
jgi:general secretion pathway protein A